MGITYYAAHREEILVKQAAYRKANPEKIRAKNAAYDKANPGWRAAYRKANLDELKAKAAAHYAANRDAVRARQTAYREAHRDEDRASSAAWYKANTDKHRAGSVAWRKANPERTRELKRAAEHLRRVRRRGGEVEVFTDAEIFERDGWMCQLCGDPIDRTLRYPDPRSVSLDHMVPVSRGGDHTRANVQAAHLRCNISKGALRGAA